MNACAITIKDKTVLFDKEYEDVVHQHTWHINNTGYVVTNINNRSVFMHRLLLKACVDEDVHHINHNKMDNRIENLERLSKRKHAGLRGPHIDTNQPYKGVFFRKGKWEVHCQRVYGGRFSDVKEAALAYNALAIQLYGNNTYLNKI